MFSGTWTALITPFKNDQSVDFAALKKLVQRQIQAGITGLVPVGTTGESPTLTHDEYAQIFDFVVQESKGKAKVLCGTGSNSTKIAIEHTMMAKKAGADACLVVCPYYNKPTQEGLKQHFLAIAETCQIPIIVYNIKGRTGVNMTTDTLLELAKNKYIVGVKEASGDLAQIKEVIARRPADFTVLSGDDGLTLEVLKMGGDGVISVASNVLPSAMVNLVKFGLNNDFAAATSAHANLQRLFTDLFIETNPLPVKFLLAKMGLCELQYRLPLCAPNAATQEKLIETLRHYHLT